MKPHKPPQEYSRRSFLKAVGAAAITAPFVASCVTGRRGTSKLRHASFGAGGMGWTDLRAFAKIDNVEIVAFCDVDLDRTLEARRMFPKARVYQDWRQLLGKEANHIDSVNVSTPDHMHAPIAVSAMQLGKHVYVQKPLAHDLHEARRMTEIARQRKLITQMGIQIHSSAAYKVAVRMLQDGVIGKIKEVHSWCPKSWGDPSALPSRRDPVPPQFSWDLWLGICLDRPFIGDSYYHPNNWRKRLDFGTGTLGDMGCHILDPVFAALRLEAPLSVRSEGPMPNEWNWALDARIHYRFAGTNSTATEILPVTWYDGNSKPPAEVLALLEGDPPPETGSIFIGTEGTMALPHISRPLLYPDAKFADHKYPEAKEEDHWGQFVAACCGEAQTSADFSYAGPLTETILLGGVASRFAHTTLDWNAKEMKFNLREADRFVRRAYRKGWSVKQLS